MFEQREDNLHLTISDWKVVGVDIIDRRVNSYVLLEIQDNLSVFSSRHRMEVHVLIGRSQFIGKRGVSLPP